MKNPYYDECYFLNYDSYDDMHLYEVGCQKCPSDYSFGPIIRNHYILHYIISGCGVLKINGKSFPVTAGEAFITPPHILVYYQADTVDPWNYIWLHFSGTKAIEMLHQLNISIDSPIFHPTDTTSQIYQCIHEILLQHNREYYCIGNMYHLFQLMLDYSSHADNPDTANQLIYIKKTIDYIQHKYFEPIQVTDIADFCGLNRSYLTKIFKDATGLSPQEYLIDYRMKKAKSLLKQADLPINHVAYSIGYTDPLAFSKLFKRKVGVSPLEYKKRE